MNAKDVFRSKRESILARWRDHVVASYPQEAANFLKSRNDQFANPVGKRITEGLSGLLDIVFASGDDEGEQKAAQFLDDIIQVRAVQDFAPGDAVRFLFDLKDIVFAECQKEMAKLGESADWRKADRRIDALGLAGLDAYTRCRERIFEIRINELRKLSHQAMVRAGLVVEIPDLCVPGPKGGKSKDKEPPPKA